MPCNESLRGWPFGVGDRVVCNGDWGVLSCDLRRYDDECPGTEYVVHAVADEGRWLALRAPDGRIFGSELGLRRGEDPRPAFGPSYFWPAPAAALPGQEHSS